MASPCLSSCRTLSRFFWRPMTQKSVELSAELPHSQTLAPCRVQTRGPRSRAVIDSDDTYLEVAMTTAGSSAASCCCCAVLFAGGRMVSTPSTRVLSGLNPLRRSRCTAMVPPQVTLRCPGHTTEECGEDADALPEMDGSCQERSISVSIGVLIGASLRQRCWCHLDCECHACHA